MRDVAYEEMKRDGYCDCCWKDIPKGTESVIKFHSMKNKPRRIIICNFCFEMLSQLKERG